MIKDRDKDKELGFSKKNTMYVTFLVTWVLTILWFNPRLFSLFSQADSFTARIILTFFILYLDVFWLFGTYYLMLFLFTLLSKKNMALPPLEPSCQPRVAILYVTMNDFQYEAVSSCINQDYGNHHVFILDDSTQEDKIIEVNRFKDEFPDKVTVIRRKDRNGFKAGSINSALRGSITDYPYFAVIDSDGIIPKDWVQRLMPYFQLSEDLAFVQGSHRPNPRQKSRFAEDLALGITPLWTVYYGPRNDYGLVLFLGHGGIIRHDVWEKVGGFPEIVSEDLAFSTKIREMGYRGHYVSNVISHEDFPENYQQLRKQQEKYLKGGCEYIHTYLPSFLRSKKVHWFEKLDVMMSCATLFLPSLHLFFILLFSLFISRSLGLQIPLTLAIGGTDIKLWDVYIMGENFNAIWTWDFYTITLLNMLAPILGTMRFVISKPLKLIRLFFLSAVPYLSLMVVSTIGIFTYLLTRKAGWSVTGDTSAEEGIYSYNMKRHGRHIWAEKLNSTHRSVHVIELTLGLFLSFICLKTLNLALFSFSISLVLGYLVLKYGWDNKILKPLMYVPFGLILSAMGFLGLNLIGIQGVFFLFFIFHF